MSADNYMLIRREGNKYVGYHQFASADKVQFKRSVFSVDTIEEAIHLCQSGLWAGEDDMCGGLLEYGYHFANI